MALDSLKIQLLSIYGIFYFIYANTRSQKLQELAYLKDMQVL